MSRFVLLSLVFLLFSNLSMGGGWVQSPDLDPDTGTFPIVWDPNVTSGAYFAPSLDMPDGFHYPTGSYGIPINGIRGCGLIITPSSELPPRTYVLNPAAGLEPPNNNYIAGSIAWNAANPPPPGVWRYFTHGLEPGGGNLPGMLSGMPPQNIGWTAQVVRVMTPDGSIVEVYACYQGDVADHGPWSGRTHAQALQEAIGTDRSIHASRQPGPIYSDPTLGFYHGRVVTSYDVNTGTSDVSVSNPATMEPASPTDCVPESAGGARRPKRKLKKPKPGGGLSRRRRR